MVAIPRRRSLPPVLGIIRSPTGIGRKPRSLICDRSVSRKSSTRCSASMDRTVRRSTPAVRAPLLPRNRSHATSRNAGSATRLNRSSNRRRQSSRARQCSLVWILSTLRSAPSKAESRSSVFTGDGLLTFQYVDCRLAGLLRRVRASRALGLLRDLRPARRPSVGNGPARHRTGCPAERATAGGSHVHHGIDRRGRCPPLPRQPRHTCAADIRHGLPTGPTQPASELNATRTSDDHTLQPGPYPSNLSRAGHIRGVRERFLAYTFSSVLAGPGPSASADPSRTLSGLLPPSHAFPRNDCPQLHQPAATGQRWSPFTSTRFHSASWRTAGCPTPARLARRVGGGRG